MTSEEIKVSLPMRKIMEQYGVQVNGRGFARCPFHKERTASMKVYPDSYYCFGCGASGDIFTFVQQMENSTFKEAFEILGGSYPDEGQYYHQLRRYHAQKRRDTVQKRCQRINQERLQVIEEIKLQKAFRMLCPVYSEDWCVAVNRLEYLFYKLDCLIEEGRGTVCSH